MCLVQGMSEADALRQVQIALMTGDFAGVGGDTGTGAISSTRAGLQGASDQFDHPYYWASFILISNGL